ncbi:MAG: polyisoprenoid-binding protein [Acidovorax sp. 32-64-7]|nr:MAG: polyisoprenoid-binding protein [Acidovorax sp. 32-64-7]
MQMSSFFSALALGSAALLAAHPAVAQQKLVPAQSEVQFTARQMGVPLEGHFKKFDAQVSFDPAKLATKATWFNVPQFPQATFQSSAIKALGAGKFEVTGKLSIKGMARDVVVPVTLVQNGATTMATGALPLKRLAFKIGENEWADTSMVADDVQVKFKLALTGVGKL